MASAYLGCSARWRGGHEVVLVLPGLPSSTTPRTVHSRFEGKPPSFLRERSSSSFSAFQDAPLFSVFGSFPLHLQQSPTRYPCCLTLDRGSRATYVNRKAWFKSAQSPHRLGIERAMIAMNRKDFRTYFIAVAAIEMSGALGVMLN